MPAQGDKDVRRWETCGQAWIGVLRHVWAAGEAGLEDGGPIIEGPPLVFEINSLSWEDPLLHEHGDRARDGSRLPVTGAGQRAPLGADPLDAFDDPDWQVPYPPSSPS